MTAALKPSTGRIVRYVGKQGVHAHRAAIVTMADDTWIRKGDVGPLDSDMHVHLWVFTPAAGLGDGPGQISGFAEDNIAYDPDKAPGTWHWPERV